MFTKMFTLQVYQDNQLVTTVGTYPIVFLECTSLPANQNLTSLSQLSALTPDAGQVAGFWWSNEEINETVYGRVSGALQTICPIIIRANHVVTGSYSLKLLAASGYYAISIAGPSLWTFYRDTGEAISGSISSIFGSFNNVNSGSVICFLVTTNSDGAITNAKYCSFYSGLQTAQQQQTPQIQIYDFTNASQRNAFITFMNGVTSELPEPPDPYEEGGETEEGGGDGTFSEEGTDVEVPELPQVTAVSTGFIKLFNPSLSQLNSLSTYMWGTGFDLNTFKKLFADPMDCILGLSIVPVNVPSGGSETVNIGNISTGISMTRAGSQYVEVDCGTIHVTEYWGGFLDYEPYTKAEIYLPYIGTHTISADDIMGKSINVTYHVDILSGACVAYVTCGGTVLYNFIGQCSSSIPVTSRDWTNVINGVMNIAGAIGSMVATGGASAPMQIPGVAASAVNALKPNIEKSGAMGGTGGLMAIQKPYLILTRPRQAVPKNQNKYTGYPSYITTNLETVGGYTEIEHIHLENIPALGDELSEIELLLSKGVIF